MRRNRRGNGEQAEDSFTGYLNTAMWLSLSYLGMCGAPNAAVRLCAAGNEAALAAVSEGVGYFLPAGALITSALTTCIPALVARAGPGHNRAVLTYSLWAAAVLAAVSLSVGACGALLLESMYVRLVFLGAAIGAACRVFVEAFAGFHVGRGRTGLAAGIQLSSAAGTVALLVFASAVGGPAPEAVAVSLAAGPFAGLAVALWFAPGRDPGGPSGDPSRGPDRLVLAGVMGSLQGLLNLGMVTVLTSRAAALGDSQVAAVGAGYGGYNLLWTPLYGLTTGLLPPLCAAFRSGRPARAAGLTAAAMALSLLTALALSIVVLGVWTKTPGVGPPDLGNPLFVAASALLLFTVPDLVINVLGYTVPRALGYFAWPIVPTAVGAIVFGSLLPSRGESDLTGLFAAFLAGQVAWATAAAGGAVVLWRAEVRRHGDLTGDESKRPGDPSYSPATNAPAG